MIQALLVTICLAVFPYQGSSIILESGNVNGFEVVYPQKVSTLPKGGVQNAEPETKYEDAMQYEFKVNGEPVVLHLERNKGLFSKDYTETHYSPDGREITSSPPVEDHCYYHGHIQNEADSTAVISACDGLKGHFKYQGETYLIEPLKLSQSEAHAVYKSEKIDMEDESPKICGVTQTTWESDESIKTASQLNLTPEQQRYLQAQKYIELVVVADNRMYKKYQSDLCLVRKRIYEIINALNTMVRILKIHVALIALEIWSDEDKINVQESVEATLKLFEEWRENDLLPRKGHDNAQLLTDVDFEGDTVGHGPMSSLCSSKESVAIIQDHTKDTKLMGTTMAHELGHNLGMSHDTNACNCPANTCIMTLQKTNEPLYDFSSCSLEQFQRFLSTSLPQCILNKPFETDIDAPAVCGNYFVEKGEECDCGSLEDCEDSCCDPKTCKLITERKCTYGECCNGCRYMKAKTLCRAAMDECDKAEYCTGGSPYCPTDMLMDDWSPCQNNQGYCYEGKCLTMQEQCIALFNDPDMIVAKDECFDKNKEGNEYYHCRRENGVNIPCEPQDVKCGRLVCRRRNIDECIPAYYIRNPEIGMVETGTKCGDGKVCRNRHCVDVRTAS